MRLVNRNIRDYAKQAGVPLWMIAERVEISEASMTRLLRKELAESETEKIIAIIDSIVKEGVN